MYCSICIEACPFDALYWSPQFEYSELDIRDLLHEKERLAGWVAGVPAPPAPDPAAPDPSQAASARRPSRGRTG
jgi:NADH-quinone oxidoreductase subunit I